MSYGNLGRPLLDVRNGHDLHTTCRPLLRLFLQGRYRLELPVSDMAHFGS